MIPVGVGSFSRSGRQSAKWIGILLCLCLLGFVASRTWRAYRIHRLISELDWVNDRDADDREGASEELVEIGAPAVKPLIASLRDSRLDVRPWVLRTLVKIGAPAVEPLISTMKEEEGKPAVGNIGFLAQKALIEIGAPAVEPLAAALQDPNEQLRREAVSILGKIRDSGATSALIAAIKNPDARVRMIAAQQLGRIQDLDAVEPLP